MPRKQASKPVPKPSQVSKPAQVKPARIKPIVYSVCIAAVIIVGIWLAHSFGG